MALLSTQLHAPPIIIQTVVFPPSMMSRTLTLTLASLTSLLTFPPYSYSEQLRPACV